jgi:ribA/ribD-fused uncharacterized protein
MDLTTSREMGAPLVDDTCVYMICVSQFCSHHQYVAGCPVLKTNYHPPQNQINDFLDVKMSDYVFFFGAQHVASQWHPSSFQERGVTFYNAEQYMMYHKALLFNDVDTAVAIQRIRDPKRIKRLGRSVRPFDAARWDEHKRDIVLAGTRLKFAQNPHLKARLLAHPPGSLFVESSVYDRVWGIGYDSLNALANQDKWGENLLGQIITQVFQELSESPEPLGLKGESMNHHHSDGEIGKVDAQ